VTDARRDSNLDDTDSFRAIFDTYLDRQNGFVFGTNPAGIEYDGQVTNEGEGGGGGGPGSGRSQTGSGGGFNLNWDASFQVRSHVGDFGWSAEFAIPLRTLRYEAETPQTWGVNFQRNIRRKREEAYWSPISRIYSLHRLSSAGELRGLELETPRNFKVTPYALGSSERDYAASDDNELDGDVMTAVQHAAGRGDNEMILYLVSHGARVDVVAKNGQTTVDLANGPRQRIQPFPETIALLMSLGAKNSNKCVSC
jgi:hypothetical protein